MTSSPHKQIKRETALVPGEFCLTQDDFRKLTSILHTDSGINMPESKATLLYSRLAKRLRTLGLKNFHEYCELVIDNKNADERQKMVAALTTNVTRFFREPHHFDHLKTRVLPELIDAARRGLPVRIWSAGCSNGQEAYSIALTILSIMPDATKFDIKILATDIDQNMLAEGREGIYGDSILANVPPDLRKRWFIPCYDSEKKSASVAQELRELVTFRELNLFGQWPMRKTFEVIFCRNVVIYFDDQLQAEIWGRFLTMLAPKSWLYIGHSERLSGKAASEFRNDGVTTWHLNRGARL